MSKNSLLKGSAVDDDRFILCRGTERQLAEVSRLNFILGEKAIWPTIIQEA